MALAAHALRLRTHHLALTTLIGSGLISVLAVALFIRDIQGTQAALARAMGSVSYYPRLDDNPFTYSPALVAGVVVIACVLLVAGAVALISGSLRQARWALTATGGLLAMAALLAFLGHGIMHPCVDDGALFNCLALTGRDGITLAALLLLAATIPPLSATRPWRDWH
jgi:hypothetical protein